VLCAQPALEGATVAGTSFTQPPPGAHLTHRGVRSDDTGACVPAEMLFFHGPEYQKTSYATLNELILSAPDEGKPNVNTVLADPNPPSKPGTYKVRTHWPWAAAAAALSRALSVRAATAGGAEGQLADDLQHGAEGRLVRG